VQAQISGERVPALGESSAGGRPFARDRSRLAPHNLFTTEDQLREALEAQQMKVGYPVPAAGEPPAGGDGVARFSFPQTTSHDVTHTYDPASRTYAYADENGPLVDAAEGGRQIAVTNVVPVRSRTTEQATRGRCWAQRVSTTTLPAVAERPCTRGASTSPRVGAWARDR
jgi:hypothetical protein